MNANEIDFGPALADPKDTIAGLLAVFGVEQTALAFGEALTEFRRIRRGSDVDEFEALCPEIGDGL